MKQPSTLILGCMGFGTWDQNAIDSADRKKAYTAIEAALDHGINSFDHANIYTYGKAEQLFGEYLRDHPEKRDELFLQSKAGIVLNSSSSGSNTYNNSFAHLRNELEQSLRRLNTEYLDCFLVHRYDPLISPIELADSLYRLEELGLTRSVGLSNMPPSLCHAVQRSCSSKLQTFQVQLSLGHSQLLEGNTFYNLRETLQQGSASINEYFENSDNEVQAWGPLDKGAFMNAEAISAQNETALLLKQLAEEQNTSAEAIQLAWLLKLPFNLRPIIGSTRPERIASCAEATDIELKHEEWYNLWISALPNKLP